MIVHTQYRAGLLVVRRGRCRRYQCRALQCGAAAITAKLCEPAPLSPAATVRYQTEIHKLRSHKETVFSGEKVLNKLSKE